MPHAVTITFADGERRRVARNDHQVRPMPLIPFREYRPDVTDYAQRAPPPGGHVERSRVSPCSEVPEASVAILGSELINFSRFVPNSRSAMSGIVDSGRQSALGNIDAIDPKPTCSRETFVPRPHCSPRYPERNSRSNLPTCSGCSSPTQCPASSTRCVPRHRVQAVVCILSSAPGV
jgi:hypothetical protein